MRPISTKPSMPGSPHRRSINDLDDVSQLHARPTGHEVDLPRLGSHALSVYLRAMGESVTRPMQANTDLLREKALEALAARGVTEWCKGQGGHGTVNEGQRGTLRVYT